MTLTRIAWRQVLMTIGLTVGGLCCGIEAGQAQERAQDVLNNLATMSRDLKVDPPLTGGIERCGQANASYTSATRHITLCREWREDARALFNTYRYMSAAELDQVADDSELFIVLHEVGHALIDVLHLPVTGREEDVADQFAVATLLHQGDAGERAIVHTARHWMLRADHRWSSPFWDEHSVDAQRSFNLACWLYGTNPAKYAGLVGQPLLGRDLPKQRADHCEAESAKMLESLTRLIRAAAK
jgi:hypothetical protein